MNPTISVLIPVYKNHQFAIDCVLSTLAYSDDFIEIIIADDCPEEPLSEIWPQITTLSKKVRYIINDVNIGRAKNYNLLLLMAIGDFYLMLDGDDLLHDGINFLRLKNILLHEKNISVLSGRCMEFDQRGIIRWSGPHGKLGRVSGLEYYRKWRAIAEVLPHSSSIIRRVTAIELGGYPLPYISSDIALLKKLLIVGDLYITDAAISSWRYHGENTSKSNNIKDLVSNIDHILDPSNFALKLKVISRFSVFHHVVGSTKSYINGCCHQFLAAGQTLQVLTLYRSILIKYKSNFPVLIAVLASMMKLIVLLVLQKTLTKQKFRELMSKRGNYLYR